MNSCLYIVTGFLGELSSRKNVIEINVCTLNPLSWTEIATYKNGTNLRKFELEITAQTTVLTNLQ